MIPATSAKCSLSAPDWPQYSSPASSSMTPWPSSWPITSSDFVKRRKISSSPSPNAIRRPSQNAFGYSSPKWTTPRSGMFSLSIESRLKTSCQKPQVSPKPSNASSTAGSPVGPSSSSRTRRRPVTSHLFLASQMMRLRTPGPAAAASASGPSTGPLRPRALALTARAWRIVVSASSERRAHSRCFSEPRRATWVSTYGGTTQKIGLRQVQSMGGGSIPVAGAASSRDGGARPARRLRDQEPTGHEDGAGDRHERDPLVVERRAEGERAERQEQRDVGD